MSIRYVAFNRERRQFDQLRYVAFLLAISLPAEGFRSPEDFQNPQIIGVAVPSYIAKLGFASTNSAD